MTVRHGDLPMAASGEVVAVIPIRGLVGGKTRLAGVLTDELRQSLTKQMLDRVLAAALGAAGIGRVVVVSPDSETLARVANSGPRVVPLRQEPARPGHNPALDQARRWAVERGAAAMIILSGDLPFVGADDVGVMAAGVAAVTLGADHHGTGTNALHLDLTDPLATSFPFRFGVGSRQAHETAAADMGLAVATVTVPGIAFDLDTVEDWRHFLVAGGEPRSVGQVSSVAAVAAVATSGDGWGCS